MKKFALVALTTLILAAPAGAARTPGWYGPWASWYLHHKHGARPAAAPARIPRWAWKRITRNLHHTVQAGATAKKQAPPAATPAPAPKPTPAPTPTPAPAPAPAPSPTPTPTPTPPPPAPTSGVTAAEKSLADAVNAARTANGLKPLSIDAHLQQAAHDHAVDLLANNAFTHDFIKSGTAYPFSTWIGWYYAGSCAGENIAEGQPSLAPAAAVQLWLTSPGHRANLLSSSFTTMGVGLVTANGTTLAANTFGGC